MSLRVKIEEKINKKEQEIQELQNKIREAQTYIQALQDTIKILPREDTSEPMIVRPGSAIGKTVALLRKVRKPLYINEILEGIGKKITKRERVSLSGSLAGYVRKEEIFTRPAPNTYGLREWVGAIMSEEPPPDFGLPHGDGDKQKENIK